ncbi:MAG: class I SAM-dependent methyltransferase [Patescibacteria group bacterium]|jgi:ubiquinone/menaquinone biosynthesis C-methylase UbiE
MTSITERSPYGPNYSFLVKKEEYFDHLRYQIECFVSYSFLVYFPLGLRSGDTILDVGSCLGDLGHYLKFLGVKTAGIDLNKYAIKKGREMFGNECKNISFVGNAKNLPFSDKSFAAVVSQDLLEHLPSEGHANQALREMERVLRGGRMYHKITVLEDPHIHADFTHSLKWPSVQWERWFTQNGYKIIGPTTRRIPMRNGISYGHFLIERS